MNLLRLRLCLLLAVALSATAVLSAEPAEIASLRTKAEKGNAIAQYNLGLAYAEGRDDLPADQVQAFVWLTLSGDSGSTRKALAAVLATISDAQLAAARRQLESYRGTPAARNLAGTSHSTPAKFVVVAPAVSAPLVPAPVPAAPAAKPAETPASPAEPVETDDVAALRKDKHQLSDELAIAWKENDRLKTSIATAQTASTRDQQIIKLLEQRSAELTATQTELAQTKTRLTEASAHFDQLQAEATARNAAALKAREQVGESALHLAEARSRISDLQARLTAAEAAGAALVAAQSNDGSREAALKEDLAAAHKEIETAQALAASTAAKNDLLKSERQAAESARAQLAAEKETLTAQLATAGKAGPQLAELQSQVSGLKSRLTSAESARAKIAADQEVLAAQLAAAKSAAQAGSSAQAKSAALATELAAAQQSLAESKQKLAASEAARTSAVEASHRIEAAGQSSADQLAVLQSRVKSLEAESAAAAAKAQGAAKLTAELEAARQETARAQALASAAAADQAKSAASLSAAVAENTRLVNERDAAETARTQLAADKEKLATQLAAATAAAAQSGSSSQAKTAELTAEFESSRQALFEARQKLTVNETTRTALAEQLNPLRLQVKEAQAALASANGQNQNLVTERDGAAARLAVATAALATLESDLEKERLARADVVNALTSARKRLEEQSAANLKLTAKPAAAAPSPQLTAELESTRRELAAAKDQLAALSTASASARADAAKSAAQVTQLQDQLAAAGEAGEKSRAELRATNSELTTLRTSVTRLEAERASATSAAGNAAQQLAQLTAVSAQVADLKSRLAASESSRQALSNQLATAAEAEKNSTGQLAALQQQLADTKAAATAPAAAQAEAEAKLAVSLRSYSVLQAENDELKSRSEKLAAEKSALETSLAGVRNAATEAGPLRDQLRQAQAQATALTAENAQLKTRLAAGVPVAISAPTRPNAPFPAASTPAPAAAAAPRSHIVVAGDTLAKISRLYYGVPTRWPEILAANKDVLKDERSLVVGRTLVIP